MQQRGRCRCGAVLLFERTHQGYKTRCHECGAVVRLRVEEDQDNTIPVLPVEVTPRQADILAQVETTPYYGPLAQDDLPTYQEPQRPSHGWWGLMAAGGLLLILAVGVTVWWFF